MTELDACGASDLAAHDSGCSRLGAEGSPGVATGSATDAPLAFGNKGHAFAPTFRRCSIADELKGGPMSSDSTRPTELNRRQMMRAAGAGALATGLAGCSEDVLEGTTSPGTTTQETTQPAGGEEVHVYEVTTRGVDAGAAEALANELGIQEIVRTNQGSVQYVDPDRFLRVPRVSGEGDRIEDEDSPDGRRASMQIDTAALQELSQPPVGDVVVDQFESALQSAEVHPGLGFPGSYSTMTSNATFRIVDPDGQNVRLERALDTAVYLRWTLDDIPLEGAGAKVRARFTNEDGDTVPTDLRHSFRGLEEGGTVELTAPETVVDRYRQAVTSKLGVQEFQPISPNLVYVAPPLRRPNDNPIGGGTYHVQTILPHYEVGGRAFISDQEEFALLREFVPALDTEEYVPAVSVSASAEGDRVEASVDITGGTPPYKVQWALSKGTLDLDRTTAGDPPAISRQIRARQSISETTLIVEIEDANAVTVRKRTDLSVDVQPTVARVPEGGSAIELDSLGAPPGTADTGFRSTDYVNWSRGFVREATNLTSIHTDWDDNNVWENDFTPPTDDDYGLDTSDHFFAAIHGSPTGFVTPNNCCSDGRIGHTNADDAWGTFDNEWFSLCSCNVLAPDDGQCGGCNGMSRVERWGDEFDGLHQLQGFQTVAKVHGNFPDAVARNVFGRPYIAPLPLIVAWILAIENHQPGPGDDQRWDRRGVIMGPIDEGNWCNYFDYYHGNGPVGPDIPASDIDGYWELVAGVGG